MLDAPTIGSDGFAAQAVTSRPRRQNCTRMWISASRLARRCTAHSNGHARAKGVGKSAMPLKNSIKTALLRAATVTHSMQRSVSMVSLSARPSMTSVPRRRTARREISRVPPRRGGTRSLRHCRAARCNGTGARKHHRHRRKSEWSSRRIPSRLSIEKSTGLRERTYRPPNRHRPLPRSYSWRCRNRACTSRSNRSHPVHPRAHLSTSSRHKPRRRRQARLREYK